MGGFVLILALVLAIRVWMHFLDVARVAEVAARRGWQQVSVHWDPLSHGALFEKGERSYRVDFTDAQGRRSAVWCKTGMLTGVFWRA